MLKLFVKLLVFVALVGFCLTIPYLLNHYGQQRLVPLISEALATYNTDLKEISVRTVGYKFPLGVKFQQFSGRLVNPHNENKSKQYGISGDELYLRLVPATDLFSGKLKLQVGMNGVIINPLEANTEDTSHVDNPHLNNNYAQIIARKYLENFTCDINSIKENDNIKEGLKSCYTSHHASHPVELGEVYIDLLLSGEKRLVSIKKISDRSVLLDQNDVKEVNSLYRDSVDSTQVSFMENHPLQILDFFLLKKIAEEKSFRLEHKDMTTGVSPTVAYLFYIVTKNLGVEAADYLIQHYKTDTTGVKEFTLKSAFVGKISQLKNISEEEFLSPTFFSQFSKEDIQKLENGR